MLHLLCSSVNNLCVKTRCFIRLHPLPLHACKVGTHLVRTKSGHSVGASCDFGLGGPFDHRDVVVLVLERYAAASLQELTDYKSSEGSAASVRPAQREVRTNRGMVIGTRED
jgi:hypothetical protein